MKNVDLVLPMTALKKEETRANVITWVEGGEANCGPTTGGDTDGVTGRGIHQIEIGSVCGGIESAHTFSNNVEVLSVQVHGVALKEEDGGVLEHNLHMLPILQHLHLCPNHRNRVVGRTTRVVEFEQRR